MEINRDSETTFKMDSPLTDSLLNSQPNSQKYSQNHSHQNHLNTNSYEQTTILNTHSLVTQNKSNHTRLNSLDVYRGLTMVGMILVDNMGPYPPWFLDHAQWNGLTPADLIFPSFLFIMGMAIPLATTTKNPARLRNLFRIFALFIIGVMLNLLARKFTFDHFRILGILQRISICYAVILLIHVLTNYGEAQKRVFGFIGILCGFLTYISYMVSFDHPEIDCPSSKYIEPFCNFSGWIDRAIFGQFHMIYPNDPQGLFSNLSALFTTYIGYHFCLIMKDHKNDIKKTLKKWGIVVLILGLTVYPMTKLMPLNKKIYSASFALLTSSSSGLTILLLVILIDILPRRSQTANRMTNILSRPFIWLGRNPLFVFIFMDLLAIIMIKLIIVNEKSVWSWFYHDCFSSWISDHQVCSVVFACFFLLLWTCAAGILYRKKIFIRL